MDYIDQSLVKKIHLPAKDSHKGQNGKLMIVGGSKLFHGASLWALTVASRIVDMVYYASVIENQRLVEHLEKNLYAFINVPQGKEADYLSQADAVLIGPGMVRGEDNYSGTGENGEQTRQKTLSLMSQFPQKKWVIDAGALQVLNPDDLLPIKQKIITPHQREFEHFFKQDLKTINQEPKENTTPSAEIIDLVKHKAQEINATIVLKGQIDIIASPDSQVLLNQTGNEGMTKGGTGDVLAGLIAALVCTNDLFTAASVGVYINGLAGDELYKKVGPFFSADDLVKSVPEKLWQQINS